MLSSVAVVVLGAALILGTGASERSYGAVVRAEARREVVHEARSSTMGTQVLVGLVGIVLGILGLVGIQPVMTLTLVAVLTLSFASLLSGTSFGGRVMSLFRY